MKRLFPAMSLLVLYGQGILEPGIAAEMNPGSELQIQHPKDLAVMNRARSVGSRRSIPLSSERDKQALSSFGEQVRLPVPFALLIDTAKINIALLNVPSTDLPNNAAPLIGGVPWEFSLLELPFADEVYRLTVVDSVLDGKRGMRHVTAALVDYPDGHARFTVDDTQGLIVGTITTGDRTYRIISGPGGRQLVYQLENAITSRRQVTAGLSGISERVKRMERRHAQAEAVAEIGPWYVRISKDDASADIEGGDLGHFDVYQPAESIRTILKSTSPLTNVRGNEEFRTVSISPPLQEEQLAGRRIRFQQIIRGIPLWAEQEIDIEADGRVRAVRTVIVDPSTTSDRAHLPRIEAVEAAKRAHAEKHRIDPSVIRVASPPDRDELSWKMLAGRKLEPVWVFRLSSEAGFDNFAEVSAYTGEVALFSSTQSAYEGDSVKENVYRTTSGSPSGPGTDTQLVWKEVNEGDHSCWASGCDDLQYARASYTSSLIGMTLEAARGGSSNAHLCCSNMGTLNIIVDTPFDANPNDGIPPSPVYHSGTNSILLTPNDAGNEWSRSSDAIAHEYAHAYMKAYNLILTFATEDFASVLKEGLADAMAGALAQRMGSGGSPPHHNWGNAWIMGDAAPPLNSPRDMRTNRSFSFALQSQPNYHDRSMAISNFFYRLSQSQIATDLRLVELVRNVADTVKDDEVDGFDLEDLRQAILQSVKPGEVALLQKVNEIWAAMDDTVVVIGDPPAAPWVVDGQLYNACSNGVTSYSLYWSPSQGASSYEGWVRFSDGQYHYSYTFAAGITTGFAHTPYNSDVKMKACNQYGCSPLSIDSLPLAYMCQ